MFQRTMTEEHARTSEEVKTAEDAAEPKAPKAPNGYVSVAFTPTASLLGDAGVLTRSY